MPLPTLVKTWQVSKNNLVAMQGTNEAQSRRVMSVLKSTMLSFASNPPVLRGSSNGTTAGLDGVDRLTLDSHWNFQNSGSPHSWYVLRFPNIATNFEICIDTNSAANWFNTWVVSPSAGFTGGSTTARPTATDEVIMLNTTDYYPNLTSQFQVHAWMSTDGEAFHLTMWRANQSNIYWHFEKARNPRTGWANPAVWYMRYGNNSAMTFSGIMNTVVDNGLWRAKGAAGANLTVSLTGESCGSTFLSQMTPTGSQANDFDSAWDFYPIGLVSNSVGGKGRLGILHDIWWAPVNVADADTAPNNASDRQFAKFGCLWLPWDPGGSTIPLIT